MMTTQDELTLNAAKNLTDRYASKGLRDKNPKMYWVIVYEIEQTLQALLKQVEATKEHEDATRKESKRHRQ